jgi:phosphatidate cytidylyltransferase
VLLAVLGGVHGVSAIVLAAALIAGYELAAMSGVRGPGRLRHFLPVSVLAAAGVTAAIGGAGATAIGFWVAAVIAGGCLAEVTSRPGNNRRLRITVVLASIYFGAMLAHAAPLSAIEDGRRWVLLAILSTFAVDTGAFFVGSWLGKHRLAPKISPKKSWEGVFGGTAAAIGAAIALDAILGLPLTAWQAALLGLAVTVSGVCGDLYESWLKRRAGVKDSGALIPGHGGILDRIDSLAPNIAVVYWAAQWSGA